MQEKQKPKEANLHKLKFFPKKKKRKENYSSLPRRLKSNSRKNWLLEVMFFKLKLN